VGDGGVLSYQWYSNAVDSNAGGTAVQGATGDSYTPPTDVAGTVYYYVVVTNYKDVTGQDHASLTSDAAAVSVAADEPDPVPVLSVSIDGGTAITEEGGTLQLTVTVLPVDATNAAVTWASSDDDVATVDANGLVTAVANGTVTITATAADGSGANDTHGIEVSVVTGSGDPEPEPVRHPYDGRTFNIVSAGGQLVDIKWAATTSETPVWLYGQNATVAQQFRFEYVRDMDGLAYYYIVNPNSGMVLDVMGAGTAPGTDVWQYAKNGTNAQLWTVVENGDGTVLIRSALSNHLVLDVEGARFATGTPLQVHPANGTAAQDFTLRDCAIVANGTYTFVSALDANIVLDVPGASTAGEVALNTYTANGTAAQRFALDYDAATGYYTITAECSGLMVDVKAASAESESTVWQYTPNGTVAQRWLLVPTGNADEFYVFAATGAGALDVHHARVGDGIPVWTYTPNATAAQRWVLRAA
jgi:hypothetical protein